jgi:hypothetical protein
MPTPCSRCRRSGSKCLVDIRSGRYKTCNDAYKLCDLRVTFREFEKLARLRAELVKKSEELDNELTRAEEEVARTYLRVIELRNRARTARKRAIAAKLKEDEAYSRKAAGIAKVSSIETTRAESSLPSSKVPPSVVDIES